uniref:Glycoprotein hormone subunit alpha 2 n=1 Tax=Podarcis muralis TaxID=64176 RepID=A0A670JXK2_PODMU
MPCVLPPPRTSSFSGVKFPPWWISYICENVMCPLLLPTHDCPALPPPLPAFSVTIKSDPRGSCRSRQTVHACVGYCESSAFPSKYSVLLASNFKHNITSVSQCCTIAKMQKVSETDTHLCNWNLHTPCNRFDGGCFTQTHELNSLSQDARQPGWL